MPLSNAVKQPLPYIADSAALFAPVAHQPWSVFLDSAAQGRYDIIACEPVCTLRATGARTLIERNGRCIDSGADPFYLLRQELGPLRPKIGDLPFTGGAIGYFGYDLARRLEKLPAIAADAEAMPDMAIGIYQWAVVVDHQRQESWLTGYDLTPERIVKLTEQFSRLLPPPPEEPFLALEPPRSNLDRPAYTEAFKRIKAYLAAGDCYQINLTQRFQCPCQGDPWVAYQRLRQLNAAPFGAYLNPPDGQILSSSPERFLKVADGRVETKPIKGTRRRAADPAADLALIEELASSEKDRAENLMIVDLLRNDLGRCCQDGSIHVPALFAVESFATVHHLVSTVTGQLAADKHALDLLRGCFPGGSITGAPKIRAMQIIEELEPHRRGVYCGAIGYIGFNGDMDTNIAIRTLVVNQGRIRFWAGGGIVFDSEAEAEYQECFDKAAALLQLLAQFQPHADH